MPGGHGSATCPVLSGCACHCAYILERGSLGRRRCGQMWAWAGCRVEATWFASKDRSMLVRHDWSRGWRQVGGAVGIKQSVGDRPDLVAPCARTTLAVAHLPPRPHAPSLNLPFPNPRSLIYTTRPSSYTRISPSSPRCRCGCYYVPFSLSTSAKCRHSFIGLCPHSFSAHHRSLGPAVHSLDLPQSTLLVDGIAYGRLTSPPPAPRPAASFSPPLHTNRFPRAWTVSTSFDSTLPSRPSDTASSAPLPSFLPLLRLLLVTTLYDHR